MKKTIVKCGALLLVTACSAHPIEVGTGQDRTKTRQLPPPSHGADDPPLPEWPDPDACALQSDLPIKGVWDGYFGQFKNPVADFRVDIRGASEDGGLCGTVAYDPTKPPPLPVADTAAYAPQCAQACELSNAPPLLAGFVFTILQGRAQGTKVQFFAARSQPWQEWCKAQSTYADENNPGRFKCLPSWGGGANAACSTGGCCLFDPLMQEAPVDCGRVHLCNIANVCQCNAARCVAGQNFDVQMDFDFTGDSATGTARNFGVSGDALLVRVK